MKIKIVILLILSVLLFISVGYSNPGLAIMDFENKTSYSDNIGRGASDILATELIKLNKFDL
jgi:curli biogenesis system outer membrane secretion channel CsgG